MGFTELSVIFVKREKNDIIIFIVSILINLLIVFFIPELKIEKVVDKKLKVGLVLVQNRNEMPVKKQSTKKQALPVKKTVAEDMKFLKEEAKIVDKSMPVKKEKIDDKKVEIKENKKITLDDLEKSFSTRDVELLAIQQPTKIEKNSDIKKDLLDKKNLEETQKITDLNKNKNILKNDDIIDYKKNIKLESTKQEQITPFIDGEKDKEVSGPILKKNKVEGLPSGYRLGVEDGDVLAIWDKDNREPKYPETAQNKGMQGKVLLKIELDSSGKVRSVLIEKGSGVPEINEAIETIARTWKIYLSKNGLNIKGAVTLEYIFKLQGNDN